MSTITKQIYRYTHKRNMRHNENLWPFLKIRRNESGEIVDFKYKNKKINIVPLSQLYLAYNGSILLLTTGPSINDMDLSKIPQSIPVTGVNGAWHLNKKISFSLYIIVDMTFIDKKPEIVKDIILSEDMHFFTTAHGIIKTIKLFGTENIKCKISIIEDICYRIYMPSIKKESINESLHNANGVDFHSNIANIAYSNDIRVGIFDTGTVAYWALQLLVFLGFKNIYIAGLDMSNFSQPRFYEKEGEQLPSFLENKLNTSIIPGFELAQKICKNSGINIVNLSTRSAIPSSIFPKIDYQNIFLIEK